MKHHEPVHHIMSVDPITVHEKQKVSEVQGLFIEHGIHHIPVVSGPKLIGLITANDLLRVSFGDTDRQDPRQVAALLDTMSIRDVMKEDLITLDKNDTIRRAAALLSDGSYHCLPVLDDNKALVGLVTSTDLIRYLHGLY